MFRPSQLFSMTLYIATSSIVPLSKQRHERKEHSQRRMALNGRLIYRIYRAYMKNITALKSWSGWIGRGSSHRRLIGKRSRHCRGGGGGGRGGGERASSIIQHVGCINIFFLPIKDTRNYGAFEQKEHVRHFCVVDTSQRCDMVKGRKERRMDQVS